MAGHCGFSIEKALNILLELSASSCKEPKNGQYCEVFILPEAPAVEVGVPKLTDGASDSTSHSSKSELQNSIWSLGCNSRNYFKALTSSEVPSLTSSGGSESELPQKVLESLFNMPRPKSCEHEPNIMNWRNVVKKMESLGQKIESCPSGDGKTQPHAYANGDEYLVFRKTAKQHWDSTKSYYQKAATAYTNGKRDYAAYLSEQGRLHSKMAREADEKASKDIFKARNKSIENVVTIDLHGQHVKQAMRLLKLHLLFGACVRSVQSFRVITGCGSQGVGKSKMKQSSHKVRVICMQVVTLLEKERIEWSEENRGTLFIRLDGQREFSFLDSESDSE
ncbi:unnamed protein product [Ilex paraguariensis]|uniref:Smr domain-containing protein n=1 Tax=Ilex paraguariensis TaxID=185542 RepID=A0ABC8SMS3_9AQUA